MGALLVVGGLVSLWVVTWVVLNLRGARACVRENHLPCWREPRLLRHLRRGTRALRWAIVFALAGNGLVEAFLVTVGWATFAVLLGLWMVAVAGLGTQLAWPPELERRLMRLEREAQQPWDVIA